MSFREIEKTHLQVLVPPAIDDAIRDKSRADRKSLSEAATEILCRGLNVDPGDFDIEAKRNTPVRGKGRRKTAATA